MLKVFLSPERRERPSRAAAPTKNMKDPDSEDDDQPFKPRGPSSAKYIRSDDADSSSGSSPESITLISAPSSTLSMATLNRPSSPKKRRSPENESGSPTKKSRKIVIKTKKSTQAITPVPSQAEATPQPASTGISQIEAIEAIEKHLETLKNQMMKDAADRAKDKKKIESIEQALQEAKTGETGEQSLAQLTDDGQDLRKENQELYKDNRKLHNENHELKKRMSELRHHMATLKQGSIAPTSFKVIDGDVEREWKGIAFDIRNFVSQILTKRPYRDSALRGANQNDVQALKKQLNKDVDTAPYHFQRYIWVHLIRGVFQGGKATWGGPAGNAFHRYCLDISEIEFEGMEQLSQFKAGQAALLSKSFDEHNREQARDIVREMALTLEIFMDPEEKVKKDGKGPKLLLMAIVRRAVELNDKFLRSRAFFLTNWLAGDFEWDGVEIRHYSGERGGEQEVDVEISPRLRKIGNADGRCFDQATEICKPMVTVVLK